MEDYGLASHFEETKEWYDGYHFGKADIYCPWDVINYVDQLKESMDETLKIHSYNYFKTTMLPNFRFSYPCPPYRSGSLRLGEGLAGAAFSAACASFSMTDSRFGESSLSS